MRWSDVDISFGPEDHPNAKLSDRNLHFMVKISIGRHKVANIRRALQRYLVQR
jgi:hypothetical protein